MMEPEGRRTFSASLIIPIVALAVLIAIIAVIAITCTGGGSNDTPSVTPTPAVTPTVDTRSGQTAALAQYVQDNMSATYAGDCSDTSAEHDAGSICSVERGVREGVHAYVLGQTASEGTEWVMVEQQATTWRVVDSTPITPENSTIPGIPWPLEVGAQVVVVGTGSCLNVRTEPGGTAVDCITEGAAIQLAAGPQEAQDRAWWRVEGRDGWVAADYLRYPDATTDPVPTQAPPTSIEVTPEASATP
jgi:hypothetical protein